MFTHNQYLTSEELGIVFDLQEKIEEEINESSVTIEDSHLSEAIYVELNLDEEYETDYCDTFYTISIRNHSNSQSNYNEAIWLSETEINEIPGMLKERIKEILKNKNSYLESIN